MAKAGEITPVEPVRTADELARCKLAQVEFVERDMKRMTIASPPAVHLVGGEPSTSSKAGLILDPLRITWARSGVLADGRILIHVPGPGMPAPLAGVRDVEPVKLTRNQYDDMLLRDEKGKELPWANVEPRGRFSRAHTLPYYTYPFTADYDPLQNDAANWALKTTGGGSSLRAQSTVCDYVYNVAYSAVQYLNVSVGTMPTADYSLGSYIAKPTQDADTAVYRIWMRYRFTTVAYDFISIIYNGLTSGNDFILMSRKEGSTATLGSADVSGNAVGVVESVGTQFKAYWNGGEVFDVGYAGAPTEAYGVGLNANSNATQTGVFGDFTVYVTAVGHPAIRRFGGIKFAAASGKGVW